mmetsp:Transcript_13284/g.43364  ORF Transcript_13284/g.43364 Transcript_13284/m.43364 type:complete len:212 (+) Transcript_13284:29-664(+)
MLCLRQGWHRWTRSGPRKGGRVASGLPVRDAIADRPSMASLLLRYGEGGTRTSSAHCESKDGNGGSGDPLSETRLLIRASCGDGKAVTASILQDFFAAGLTKISSSDESSSWEARRGRRSGGAGGFLPFVGFARQSRSSTSRLQDSSRFPMAGDDSSVSRISSRRMSEAAGVTWPSEASRASGGGGASMERRVGVGVVSTSMMVLLCWERS